MKKLTLPEPARQLWLATRDILTTLGLPSKPWIAHLGGGTVIAARLKHRQSTDIDVMIRSTDRLTMLTLNDDQNLARRLGGIPKRETESQIKVELPDGIIDINTVTVRPKTGASESRSTTSRSTCSQRRKSCGESSTGRRIPLQYAMSTT